MFYRRKTLCGTFELYISPTRNNYNFLIKKIKQDIRQPALTHKFNFIFLSYKNITFLTAFSWFSESQGIVSP